MKFIFKTILIPVILLLQTLPGATSPSSQQKEKSFKEWCEQKHLVSLTTQKTINVLLKVAKAHPRMSSSQH
jgi:hypothetical protein